MADVKCEPTLLEDRVSSLTVPGWCFSYNKDADRSYNQCGHPLQIDHVILSCANQSMEVSFRSLKYTSTPLQRVA